jgi:sugar phosphate isomerase/epimerase
MQSGRLKTIPDIAAVLDQAGLDGLEINAYVLEAAELFAPGLGLSPDRLDSLDCSRISLHSNHVDFNLGSLNPYVRRAASKQLLDEAALASAHGIGILNIHPGWVKKIERRQALRFFWDSLSSFFSACPEQGPRICLENMDQRPEKLCNRAAEIRSTLQRFPRLNLTVDFAHLGLTGADIGAFVAEFDQRIAHVHISGVQNGVPHGRVSLDESRIDFGPYLRRLAGRDLIAVIENRSWEAMLASKSVIEHWLKG